MSYDLLMMFQFLEEIKQQIKQGGVATVSVATAKI